MPAAWLSSGCCDIQEGPTGANHPLLHSSINGDRKSTGTSCDTHTHTHPYKGQSHKLQWTNPCQWEFLFLWPWRVYRLNKQRSEQRTDNIEPQWRMCSCTQATSGPPLPHHTHTAHLMWSVTNFISVHPCSFTACLWRSERNSEQRLFFIWSAH